VRDEFDPRWELEGMKQTIRYALLLINELNEKRQAPQLKKDLPFKLEK
jgi:hypothetical protein